MTKPNRVTIRTIRELRGISQRELGRRTGVSSGYVARAESGDLTPSRAMTERIAEALDVPVEALTGSQS